MLLLGLPRRARSGASARCCEHRALRRSPRPASGPGRRPPGHGIRVRRRVPRHGPTVAAITAHATFNVMVGAGAMAERDMSVSDNGGHGVRHSIGPRRRAPRCPTPEPTRAQPRRPTRGCLPLVRRRRGARRCRPRAPPRRGPRRARPERRRQVDGGGGPARPPSARRADARTLRARPARACRASAGRRGLQEVGFPPGLRVREAVDLVRAHHPDAVATRRALDRLDLGPVADREAAGSRAASAVAWRSRSPRGSTAGPLPRRADRRDGRHRPADPAARCRRIRRRRRRRSADDQQLGEAEEIASRVVLLHAGRVALDGTVRRCGGTEG